MSAIEFPLNPVKGQEHTHEDSESVSTVWICENATGPIWARKAIPVVKADGTVAMTGQLEITPGAPTEDNHAARKDYVDAVQANVDSNDTDISTNAAAIALNTAHRVEKAAVVGKNLLANSSFTQQQRGTKTFVVDDNGQYTADRWYCRGSALAGGDVEVTTSVNNFLDYDGVDCTSHGYIMQFIKSRDLFGKTVTFSFSASATNALDVGLECVNFEQGSDTSSILSSKVNVPAADDSIVSITIDIPAGTLGGSAGNDGEGTKIFLKMYGDEGANAFGTNLVKLYNVKLELGEEYTGYDNYPLELEAIQCGAVSNNGFGYVPWHDVNKENLFDNPTFDVRQRGDSVFNDSYTQVGFDRWYFQSINAAASGDADNTMIFEAGTGTLYNRLIQQATSTDNDTITIFQPVEKERLEQGRTYTFSGIIYLENLTYGSSAELFVAYKADDKGIGTGTKVSLGLLSDIPKGEGVPFSVSFTMPTHTDYVSIGVYGDGWAFTTSGHTMIRLSEPQLCLGEATPEFIAPDRAIEMGKCQQYFQVIGGSNHAYGAVMTMRSNSNGSNGSAVGVIRYATPFKRNPSLVRSTGSFASSPSVGAITSFALANGSREETIVTAVMGTVATAKGYSFYVQQNNDADALLYIGCEK